ncbi:hypothetical protein NOF55_15035 [Rhizobiaceae bacterium BDR2-2]|uniref:Uncharacterized protein n=1 Tax=Ectorhizobium quercum TaxID=2965071 RepID=A0AAE3N1W0_9HYPH|nr:hypothetical protein [Ectorhizobium quercum]MCX8998427.1 hypothetical protein [Ectorhizobium quercum]
MASKFKIRFETFAAMVLIIAATVCAGHAAWASIAQSRNYYDLIALAQRADRTGRIPESAPAIWETRLQAIVDEDICRSDIVMAGMNVVLEGVDRRIGEPDAELRRSTLASAEIYLRHALACLPNNGNVWLRLAMVRSLEVMLPAELATLLARSQALLPGEANAVLGRFMLWNQLPETARALASNAYASDLAIACSRKGVRIKRIAEVDCEAAAP